MGDYVSEQTESAQKHSIAAQYNVQPTAAV